MVRTVEAWVSSIGNKDRSSGAACIEPVVLHQAFGFIEAIETPIGHRLFQQNAISRKNDKTVILNSCDVHLYFTIKF